MADATGDYPASPIKLQSTHPAAINGEKGESREMINLTAFTNSPGSPLPEGITERGCPICKALGIDDLKVKFGQQFQAEASQRLHDLVMVNAAGLIADLNARLEEEEKDACSIVEYIDADASTLELKRKTELKALLNQVDDQTTELAEYEKTITQNESALTNVRRNEEILQETLRQNETKFEEHEEDLEQQIEVSTKLKAYCTQLKDCLQQADDDNSELQVKLEQADDDNSELQVKLDDALGQIAAMKDGALKKIAKDATDLEAVILQIPAFGKSGNLTAGGKDLLERMVSNNIKNIGDLDDVLNNPKTSDMIALQKVMFTGACVVGVNALAGLVDSKVKSVNQDVGLTHYSFITKFCFDYPDEITLSTSYRKMFPASSSFTSASDYVVIECPEKILFQGEFFKGYKLGNDDFVLCLGVNGEGPINPDRLAKWCKANRKNHLWLIAPNSNKRSDFFTSEELADTETNIVLVCTKPQGEVAIQRQDFV